MARIHSVTEFDLELFTNYGRAGTKKALAFYASAGERLNL
jgi:hypothetical protein